MCRPPAAPPRAGTSMLPPISGHSWGEQTWNLDPGQLSVAWLESVAWSPVSVPPNRCSHLGFLHKNTQRRIQIAERDTRRAGVAQRPCSGGHQGARTMGGTAVILRVEYAEDRGVRRARAEAQQLRLGCGDVQSQCQMVRATTPWGIAPAPWDRLTPRS